MDRFNLDKNLKHLKEVNTADTKMSSLVRSRLDDTYASLSELPAPRRSRLTQSRLRRTASVTIAAGFLGAVIFSSGFVSPVMAETLKNIPVIGSIFSSVKGDVGLRTAGDLGLASTVNSSASYENVKLEVTETVFDGRRTAFLLNVTAPNLQNGEYDNGNKVVQLSNAIHNAYFWVDGKRQGDPGAILKGGTYMPAGKAFPNTLIFEDVLDMSGIGSIPDSFNMEATIILEGIDHEFKLDIPFHKTTNNIVNVHPNAVAANDELTFSVTDLLVTPSTTRIQTSIALNNVLVADDKDQNKLSHIGTAVFDDQGRELPRLHGDGTYEANRLTYDHRYASIPGTTKYLIVKPFVYKKDPYEKPHESQYIKELEMKIELPAAN